jgi:hypothetical protein
MTRDEIVSLLEQGIYTVTFTKVNGELRHMPCTLKADLLPKLVAESNDTKQKKINLDNLSVWCTDKNEWRSFKIANVVEVKPFYKTYTVTLEEDPDTGDLILPFTDEMLDQVGWREGDVLKWIDNKDGSWGLVKQANETAK